jgi:hypothetical protein
MSGLRASYPRKVRSNSGRNLRAIPNGEECREFQRECFSNMGAGDIAALAGCTKRAAKNIRAGENNIQMKFLVTMLRNDPAFRASFFEFCGGQLQFPPEVTAALSKAASWFQSEHSDE